MNSSEKLAIARRIDLAAHKILAAGGDDTALFIGMAELMPDFKRLMDATLPGEMDSLASQFDGFYRYAKVLETIAGGIAAGEIDVP
ncbi:MAG: hypothetical protein A2289_11015 [Deltaproteobacteria bacterium RIFOXYA12_FULL_58_15]|nr:MAG: hypothetical protein A2289_11015 [Deltaproteobacteria bacterium RIFOXYA12_FULL_58_15]OGR12922.1 MAG: hypothetical protein A2341_09200 [Deltaproteobacteria bacterium RIFOXYB12_FULL_58_9]